MLQNFPTAYGVEDEALEPPDEEIIVAVLGKSHGDITQYSDSRRSCFGAYHSHFKIGSKPAAHLSAMALLDDVTINAGMPKSIGRMLDHVREKLDELPE